MPVERFRNFEDAERALWLSPGDPQCVPKWAALLALSRRMSAASPFSGGRQIRFHRRSAELERFAGELMMSVCELPKNPKGVLKSQ